MAGTADFEDQIPGRWKMAYDQVRVLAEKRPAKDAFLPSNPLRVLLVGVHQDRHHRSPRSAAPKEQSRRRQMRSLKLARRAGT